MYADKISGCIQIVVHVVLLLVVVQIVVVVLQIELVVVVLLQFEILVLVEILVAPRPTNVLSIYLGITLFPTVSPWK
jgi:hypothetical protein